MEVENKEEIRKKADEITKKLFEQINSESNALISDSPINSIYLMVHITSLLSAKACVAMAGFGKIYSIEKLETNSIYDWIMNLTKSYIDLIKSSAQL